MQCRYYIYHVKFNVCLVTKPLVVFSSEKKGWTLRFCFWGWIMWKMYNKTIIEFGFRMISWIIKTSCPCYLPQPSASADNTDLGFDNSWYHAKPHPIIVLYLLCIQRVRQLSSSTHSRFWSCYLFTLFCDTKPFSKQLYSYWIWSRPVLAVGKQLKQIKSLVLIPLKC